MGRWEQWVRITWKCVHARHTPTQGEMWTRKNRENQSVSETEVVALKAGEYSTWWQWVPEHRHPLHLAFLFILQVFHLKRFYVSPVRRGALADAYTPAFSSNESQIPWNLFMLWAIDWLICFTCHLQFIISAASGRTYCYLRTASFSAPREDSALEPARTPTCSCWEGLCRWRCFCRAAINIHQFLVRRIHPPSRLDTHTHNSETQKKNQNNNKNNTLTMAYLITHITHL